MSFSWLRTRLAPRMVICSVLLAGLLTGPGVMASPVERGFPFSARRLIYPQDELEWCAPLVAGQLLHYRYSASDRLGFSLHYHLHEDGATLLRKDEIRSDEGEFRATFTAEYCLRWQNYEDHSLRVEFDLR